jgi:hypothetical protein
MQNGMYHHRKQASSKLPVASCQQPLPTTKTPICFQIRVKFFD